MSDHVETSSELESLNADSSETAGLECAAVRNSLILMAWPPQDVSFHPWTYSTFPAYLVKTKGPGNERSW